MWSSVQITSLTGKFQTAGFQVPLLERLRAPSSERLAVLRASDSTLGPFFLSLVLFKHHEVNNGGISRQCATHGFMTIRSFPQYCGMPAVCWSQDTGHREMSKIETAHTLMEPPPRPIPGRKSKQLIVIKMSLLGRGTKQGDGERHRKEAVT